MSPPRPAVAIVGAGPAGLIAAETLSAAGAAVTVYERMPSVGRKLLMAGRGGLNLTHSEDFERFVGRYGDAAARLRPMLEALPPAALTAWAEGLGQPTFTGSSGRIFPKALKASPLLRAWLLRLQAQGVEIRTRWDWQGWDSAGALVFRTPAGEQAVTADATILALGGASWPRLGSNGAWAPVLANQGVAVTPLRPANVGVEVVWSEVFRTRFEGQPLKNVELTFGDRTARGDAMVTGYGLEGGAVYALSSAVRDALAAKDGTRLRIDLRPDQSAAQLTGRLARPHGGQSLANHLRKALNLSALEVNLLREAHGKDLPGDGRALAEAIKNCVLALTDVRPIARAISTAGGVGLDAVDDALMLKARPGVFVAGEMLDWEAPTGGYLLQACFASGKAAAEGILRRLG
ncbi:aminoacetone oxidase family FAD-binding enzyme [Phenylobacterium hankyongense]|uniref:Aminoacetone oxidase family FAD-binding enzyme n=1 Tax=Phenylobacterium hankyongense TaxID=1813876 RepID=A0A328ATV9_9CAUL|nr:TIGR03862 family flavoprotein [Phenylobacterium hankyongense]RAK58572.1 aminoacetone oxidase family FAD-binding enzyme [Phenylobacterium hankyongense]